MNRLLAAAFVAFAVLAAGGCATSRSEVALAMPAAAPSAAGKPIVIGSVKDQRAFEQAPSDPGIPSLGFEGASQATAETKLRAIGRKRNGYGMALGDVLLQNGQTVESVVRDNVTAALQQSGYKVVPSAGASASTPVVDVTIRKFWSWLQPGFWAITLHSAIWTDIQVTGSAAPTAVQVTKSQSMQMATDGNWIEAIGETLAAYRAEFVRVFAPK